MISKCAILIFDFINYFWTRNWSPHAVVVVVVFVVVVIFVVVVVAVVVGATFLERSMNSHQIAIKLYTAVLRDIPHASTDGVRFFDFDGIHEPYKIVV